MRFQLAGTSPNAAWSATAGTAAPAPAAAPRIQSGGLLAKKTGREGQDQDQPRDDEAHPADDGTDPAAQPPGAEDGQLRRRRTGQEVGGGDGVFELLGVDPVPLLDAHAPQ